ncbi:MAG: hypothetical protein M1828_007149 [Chrysothrix sp. TS-e1954]|nr:MAG: hypothetical protein M1828_007149 [Chrysothrix sp. TS-e1954]
MQQTRPTHRSAQTLRQAKRDYTKHGPRISSQEARQLARGAELMQRAERIKEADRRRKKNLEKKREKEQRDREVRRSLGVQDADEKKRFGRLSQRQSFLDGFVKAEDVPKEQRRQVPVTGPKPLEATSIEKGGLDEDDLDDEALIELVPALLSATEKVPATGEQAMGKPVSSCLNTQTEAVRTERKAEGLEDGWGDFLISNTQIQREIDVPRRSVPSVVDDDHFPFLSTQDVTISNDDLEEFGVCSKPGVIAEYQVRPRQALVAQAKRASDCELMPPPPNPVLKPSLRQSICDTLHLAPTDFDMSTQDYREIHLIISGHRLASNIS